LTLPSGSTTTANDLRVVSTFGDGTVNGTGNFTVPVNQRVPQLVAAVDTQNRPILLNIVSGGAVGAVNIQSTALSLLSLNPLLATSDPEDRQALLNLLNGLPQLDALEAALSVHIRDGGNLGNLSNEVENALEAAVQAALQAIRGGAGISTRGVTPTSQQSGVLVQPIDDTVASNIRIRLQNFRKRHVQAFAAPANSAGDATGAFEPIPLSLYNGTTPLLGSPESALGTLLTGRVASSREQDGKVVIPTGADQVRVEVWGPGFSGILDVPQATFLERAKVATLATMLYDIIGPSVNQILGIQLVSGTPSPQAAAALATLANNQQVTSAVREFAYGDKIASSINLMRFMLSNSAAREFLTVAANEAGVAQHIGTVSSRTVPYLQVVNALFAAVNFETTLQPLVASRPVEVFFVKTGTTSGPPAFQVTLNWNKPNDVDLHTFAPNGEHSSYEDRVIAAGELDIDDTNGFGPENFTARRVLPGTYRIAVNLYSRSGVSGATTAQIVVKTSQGTQTVGSYDLTTSNSNTGYPITGNTTAWWRPCDIRVNANGSVEILPADTTVPLTDSAAIRSARKPKVVNP
jgi:hypothetical protein